MGLDVADIGMGLDLGLDLGLFAARSADGMAAASKGAPPAAGIEACIRSLEEERRKIEVFGRELPLCVRLLADVIEELNDEAARRGGDLELETKAADDGDKKKWMSTAQLWVDSDAKSKSKSKSGKEQRSEMTSPEPKAVPAVPPPRFRRDDNATGTARLPAGLSLLPPAAKTSISSAPAVDEHRQNATARFSAPMSPSGGPTLNLHAQTQQQQQQQARKARRTWSPELHRQFVAALNKLGGPQVATPKQIREMMKVDGLTNDEVKSHLQKYWLHNRRAPGSAMVSQPIVFVGGLWMPQEQSSSQSGSPQGPFHISTSSLVVSSAATVSCEEEDGRSESYGWK